MKNLTLITVITVSLISSCSHSNTEKRNLAAMDTPQNRKTGDSPWLELTDELALAITEKRFTDIKKILSQKTPAPFWKKMETESEKTKLTELWGKSLNFDEVMKSEIVKPEILDFLFKKFKVFKRDNRIVHAGIEHTYGYLFSNLKTSFGYKRQRWVEADIEKGFNLFPGILSPYTTDGALFTNVTYFFGRIAFFEDALQLNVLGDDPTISDSLQTFPFEKLKWTRLRETVSLIGGRTVELRTDFVPFTHLSGTTNTVLLIYSVLDSLVGVPKLISGFPVSKTFMDVATAEKELGQNKQIITKYNAYVEGFTKSSIGSKEALKIHE